MTQIFTRKKTHFTIPLRLQLNYTLHNAKNGLVINMCSIVKMSAWEQA